MGWLPSIPPVPDVLIGSARFLPLIFVRAAPNPDSAARKQRELENSTSPVS